MRKQQTSECKRQVSFQVLFVARQVNDVHSWNIAPTTADRQRSTVETEARAVRTVMSQWIVSLCTGLRILQSLMLLIRR